MPRPLDPRQGPQRDVKQIVHRRCRVCEWEADQIESVGAAFDCPWCHAPTSIARVLPQVGAPEPAGHPKNPHAAALGRLGGLKGGPARAARLTARERRESARKAALARWAKNGQRRFR
jgi:pyruvate-formate lyase-activating enzyme